MTQAKHTPGPWHVYPHGDSPGIDADNFSIVLFGESDLEDGGVRGENEAEAMANARLIAAAPDLLAALKMAEDALSRSPFSTMTWPTGLHPNTGISQIRDAIAKAEGA